MRLGTALVLLRLSVQSVAADSDTSSIASVLLSSLTHAYFLSLSFVHTLSQSHTRRDSLVFPTTLSHLHGTSLVTVSVMLALATGHM